MLMLSAVTPIDALSAVIAAQGRQFKIWFQNSGICSADKQRYDSDAPGNVSPRLEVF